VPETAYDVVFTSYGTNHVATGPGPMGPDDCVSTRSRWRVPYHRRAPVPDGL
jgi:hypothetical protein